MRLVFKISLLFLMIQLVSGEDWPQYLGPQRNGHSTETGLMTTWQSGGPEVLWEYPLGEGFGGAAVRAEKIYLLDRVDDKKDVLRCIDLNTGDQLWHFVHEDPGKFSFNGSRATPTVTDSHIYTVGPMGTVYCIDLLTNKPVWMRNFQTDFMAKLPQWAYSQSPLVYENLVIVAPQGKQTGVVAYNKDNGEIVWKTPRLCHDPGYSSPSLVTIGGIDQVVIVTPYLTAEMLEEDEDEDEEDEESEEDVEEEEEYEEEEVEEDEEAETDEPEDAGPRFEGGGVYGIDVRTGKILWNFKEFYCGITIPPVTDVGDGRLFITGGYESSATMIKLINNEGKFEVQKIFVIDDVKSQIHPAILYENYLYIQANGDDKRRGLQCMSLDGKILWETGKRQHFEWGGFLLADNLLFMMDGKKGQLHLIKPNPEEYTELGKLRILKGPQIWAPLALSEGKLVVRDKKQMKCIKIR
jgi:outer membrane protein assembly factor BamB